MTTTSPAPPAPPAPAPTRGRIAKILIALINEDDDELDALGYQGSR